MNKFKNNIGNRIEAENPGTGIGYLRTGKAVWDYDIDGGAIGTIVPKANVELPDNAIITACYINSTTAVDCADDGQGLLSIGVGTASTYGTAILLAATATAVLASDKLVSGIPTFAVPVKLAKAGNITFSIASSAYTQGRIEVTVCYVPAGA